MAEGPSRRTERAYAPLPGFVGQMVVLFLLVVLVAAISSFGVVERGLSSVSFSEVYGLLGVAFVAFVAVPLFLMTPFSNILNIVTKPLGYEYSSCPYCPEFGVKKIEYEECDNCGKEHGRGFAGAAKYADGEKYVFCSNECLDDWNNSEGSQ